MKLDRNATRPPRIIVTNNTRREPSVLTQRDPAGKLWRVVFAPGEIGAKDYQPLFEMG